MFPISNLTPLIVFPILQKGKRDIEYNVIIAQSTFKIDDSNRTSICEEQVSVRLTDEYYSSPNSSSMRVASDVCYAKPTTDIYFIDPVAYSPNGKPCSRWPIFISIGNLRYNFEVVGQREWKRNIFGGWALSEPEPTTCIPIRYENAFGGTIDTDEGPIAWPQNPIGVGFADPNVAAMPKVIQLPCIQPINYQPLTPSARCDTVGLTAVSRWWQPRLGHAGTYDDHWKEKIWPFYPSDFNEAFFNVSPQALQYPGFISGGEEVLITGLTHTPNVRFTLPTMGQLKLEAFTLGGEVLTAQFHIDTLEINLQTMQIKMVWRTNFVSSHSVFYSSIYFE